jgi:Ca-activated chloride channel family protein
VQHGVNFNSPIYFLALIAVPLVVAFALFIERRRARFPVAFTNVDLLAGLVSRRPPRVRRYIPLALLALALIAASAALAKPETRLSVPEQNATIVMLVDVSGSMRASDVTPSRLSAAVSAMNTFIDRLPDQFKVGLIAFSDTAQPLVTPTTDRTVLREQVTYLEPEAGTALGDGLAAAVKMVNLSLRAGGYVRKPGQDVPGAIVLLSDGAQNRGFLQPSQAALEAKKAGIRVYGIAFGTPNGTVTFGFGAFTNQVPVPPDPATISMISQTTGGRSFTAETASSVADVYRTLGSSIGRTSKEVPIGSWFAAAAAVCLLAAFAGGLLLDPGVP